MGLDINRLQARIISRARTANVASAASKWAPNYRVYDDTPESVNTGDGAYVELADVLQQEDDASISDGLEVLFTFHVWSEWRGKKECQAVIQNMRNTFHKAKEQMFAGDMIVNTWLDSAQVLPGADGATQQGIVRIRCSCRT